MNQAMTIWEVLFCVVVLSGFVALVGAGIFLIVRGTIRKDGFGINTGRPDCPKCGEPVSLAPRVPKSWRQALWGGWTCKECGCEMDKWGRAYDDQPLPAKWAALEADEKPRRKRRSLGSAEQRYRENRDNGYRKDRHE
jgi:hypothetical protein